MRPGVAWLLVEHPVGVGNVVGVLNATLVLECVALRKLCTDELGVDRTVDDGVGHMNAYGSEFTGHALRQ